MFKLMDKEINAILGAQTILIWTYEPYVSFAPGELTNETQANCMKFYFLLISINIYDKRVKESKNKKSN